MRRLISTIAWEARRDMGAKVPKKAVPYLTALLYLEKVTDVYRKEPAAEIIRDFLKHAGPWKGETARRLKAELRDLIK